MWQFIKNFFIRKYREWLGKHNPQKLASIKFRKRFGRELNWNDPKDLNEKINWLKFYSDTSQWTRLADKYLVRQYVKEKGFGDNLVKLYGKWDNVEDIDWKKLPSKFVMKTNNGSGDVVICKDIITLDKKKTAAFFKKMMTRNYGISSAEPHYKNMKPCVIAEELLDVTKQPIESSSLIDYKIWCFNGKPECIWVCFNRRKGYVEVATYDLDWHFHPEYSIYTHHYQQAKQSVPRPKSLNKMLEMASSLSTGFPEVRVDLYEVDGKPYFGEMTFTSLMGFMDFYTPDYLLYLGSKVKI